ncbi:unnamed protein product, partial [Didymodactylos carnosus]
ELASISPVVENPDKISEYMKYDRYADIPSRGKWSRTAIKLSDPTRDHDYINANIIKGYNSDSQYIACQAPLPNTTEDFWSMIVQHNVTEIVMLTKFEERSPKDPAVSVVCI